MKTVLKALLGTLVAFGLVFAGGALTTPAPSISQVMRTEAAPTVRIMTGKVDFNNSVCSAVVVAPGFALSAQHCSKMSPAVIDGVPVKEMRAYSDKDVVLVVAPGLKCPCATVATGLPPVGALAAVIGYPFGIGKFVTTGEYQGLVSDPESAAIYPAFTILAGPGDSGGGVFVLFEGHPVLVGTVKAGKEGVFMIAEDVTGLVPQLKGL